MSVKLTNRSRHLIIVTLNSGDTIHLAPGEVSGPIADIEVNNNQQVGKLVKANLIASLPADQVKQEKPAQGIVR